ncbi:hypothetical protein COBT_002722 [Conglomerata obtusa]
MIEFCKCKIIVLLHIIFYVSAAVTFDQEVKVFGKVTETDDLKVNHKSKAKGKRVSFKDSDIIYNSGDKPASDLQKKQSTLFKDESVALSKQKYNKSRRYDESNNLVGLARRIAILTRALTANIADSKVGRRYTVQTDQATDIYSFQLADNLSSAQNIQNGYTLPIRIKQEESFIKGLTLTDWNKVCMNLRFVIEEIIKVSDIFTRLTENLTHCQENLENKKNDLFKKNFDDKIKYQAIEKIIKMFYANNVDTMAYKIDLYYLLILFKKNISTQEFKYILNKMLPH